MAAYGVTSNRLEELSLYLRLQPDGWLYAEFDGRPAGLGGAVDFGTFATIGMMGVHPAFQRRGIARVLFEHLLQWLDARGVSVTALDASAAGAPLYPQYGFEPCGATAQFQRVTKPIVVNSAEHRSGAFPLFPEVLSSLVAYDAPFFGAERAAVLEFYAARYPEHVFVAGDARSVPRGYLVARPAFLGPWVADTPEDAEGLLRAALSRSSPDDQLVVNVPAENTDALALLDRYGFTKRRSLVHMCRGEMPQPGDRTHIYGQASFAIG
jgi:GNAT superfamily N-acetyltransferase